MAGLICRGNSGEVTLTSATAQSFCQLKNGTSNQIIQCVGLKILGKAPAGGILTPVKVRATYSTANFGTFSGGASSKTDQAYPETPNCTFGGVASVEPTTPTDLGFLWEVQPQIWSQDVFPQGLKIPVHAGKSIQFELTSATGETPKVAVEVTWDE